MVDQIYNEITKLKKNTCTQNPQQNFKCVQSVNFLKSNIMCQISNHNPDLFVNIEVISTFLGKKILWPHLNENSNFNRNIKYQNVSSFVC